MLSKTRCRVSIFLLSAVICSSLYLIWNTYIYNQPILGCSSNSGCNQVLTSHWSKIVNIPILIIGLITYAVLLILLILHNKSKSPSKLNEFGIPFICYLIILAGIWFFMIQVFILHAFCIWCCTIHTLAIIASAIALYGNVKEYKMRQIPPLALAVFSISILASTQYLFPSQMKGYRTSTLANSILTDEGNNIILYNDKLSINKEALPVLTSSESKSICLILSDHTCPHCLEFQNEISAHRKEIEQELTIYFLPSFQSKHAREINRLLLIARRVDPEVYTNTLNAIQSGSLSLNHNEIKSYLDKQFGDQFDIYLKSFSPWSYEIMDISKQVMLLNQQQAQTTSFPQVITANHVIEGVISIPDLIDLSKKSKAEDLLPTEPNKQLEKLENTKSGLVVSQKEFHLGRITKNNIGHDALKLSNKSTKPINISKIGTSCGCVTISNEKITIAPNSETIIPFEFHTKKFLGNVTHKIFLYEEGFQRPISIPITVDVWLPFKIFPYTNNLGKIAEGTSSRVQTVNFINSTRKPISLTLHEEQSPLLEITDLKTIIEGTHYELSYQIKRMPSQSISTHINLKTSHPDCPNINLPITAQSSALYEIFPEEISLSHFKENTLATYTITCNNKQIPNPLITNLEYIGSQKDKIEMQILSKKRLLHPPKISIKLLKGFNYSQAQLEGDRIQMNTNFHNSPINLGFSKSNSN